MKPVITTPTVGFISLGCPKALVDSERILTQLKIEGYAVSDDYRDAELVIVNTCGFIDEAKAESLETIEEALAENGQVIVTGCLGAKSGELAAQFPELLAVTGPQQYEQVMAAVHRHVPPPPSDPFRDVVPPQGVKLTPRHYAYLKISEGCNHRCTFCIIPSLRGDLVSRPAGEILREAEQLANAGVKELLIVSQDTSAYGADLRYRTDFWQGRPVKSRLTELCNALSLLGIWVRLHYVYPYPHVDELMPLMAEGKLLPYLDVPLQHASPRILQLMKRPAAAEKNLERIQQWRTICPDLTIRSTFIVGFPGETEEDFLQLLDFLKAAQLDRVGCFTYSPVAGAKANELGDPVPDAVKQERQAALMTLQAEISYQKLTAKIGRQIPVLIDEVVEEGAVGRSYADAPDIDGQVYLDGTTWLEPGQIVTATVEEVDEHDLWATLEPPSLTG